MFSGGCLASADALNELIQSVILKKRPLSCSTNKIIDEWFRLNLLYSQFCYLFLLTAHGHQHFIHVSCLNSSGASSVMLSDTHSLLCTYVYTQRMAWYLLQVTKGHHSSSTGDDGHKSTNRSPPVGLKVTRSLWGHERCKTVPSLSCWLSCSAAILHLHWLISQALAPWW